MRLEHLHPPSHPPLPPTETLHPPTSRPRSCRTVSSKADNAASWLLPQRVRYVRLKVQVFVWLLFWLSAVFGVGLSGRGRGTARLENSVNACSKQNKSKESAQ